MYKYETQESNSVCAQPISQWVTCRLHYDHWFISWIILCMRLANITSSLIDWQHTQNDPWNGSMVKLTSDSLRNPGNVLQPKKRTTNYDLRSIAYTSAKFETNYCVLKSSLKLFSTDNRDPTFTYVYVILTLTPLLSHLQHFIKINFLISFNSDLSSFALYIIVPFCRVIAHGPMLSVLHVKL